MKPHLQYLWYVLRHKYFVFVAGLKYQVPIWQLIIHDLSKFSPAEWRGYVRWLMMKDKSEVAKAEFDAAWEHHWLHNPHHWQYWSGGPEGSFLMPMPHHYAREMVADWAGAGRAITGRWEVQEWYAKTKGDKILHADTRAFVESLLA